MVCSQYVIMRDISEILCVNFYLSSVVASFIQLLLIASELMLEGAATIL